MHPSKVRDLLPSYAMEIEYSVEEVEAVTKYFYKTLRSKLSSLEEPTIHVHNLGNFYIKEKALDRNMDWCVRYLEKLNPADITEYGMRKSVKTNYELMKQVKEKLDNERSRRVEIITKRYGNTKKRNTNLEN